MQHLKRVTKKEQYLNGLDHDIKFLEESIKGGKSFYWLGDLIRIRQAQQHLLSLRIDQGRVISDKNYKPWKEQPHMFV